jgi:hypothetical protein
MTYDPVAAASKGNASGYGVTFQGWVRLNLQVLDADGDPLSGVTVQIGASTFTTDAEGRIAEQHLAAGEYMVTLSKATYTSRTLHYTLDRWRSEVEMLDSVYHLITDGVTVTLDEDLTVMLDSDLVATVDESELVAILDEEPVVPLDADTEAEVS